MNWEGSSITWDIFNKANLGKGIAYITKKTIRDAYKAFETALTFPENLGVGKSDRTGIARAWFWKGKTLLAMRKPAEAMNAWKIGSELPSGNQEQNEYITLCRSLVK